LMHAGHHAVLTRRGQRLAADNLSDKFISRI
jgi:hypothetical protein